MFPGRFLPEPMFPGGFLPGVLPCSQAGAPGDHHRGVPQPGGQPQPGEQPGGEASHGFQEGFQMLSFQECVQEGFQML